MTEDLMREVAGMLGTTPAAVRRAYEAKALAERAARLEAALRARDTATAHLGRLARALTRPEADLSPSEVAVELGLVSGDASYSEAMSALSVLAMIDELPPPAEKPKRGPAPRSGGSGWSADAVCEALADGPATREEMQERLGLSSGTGRVMAIRAAVKRGAVRELADERYELVEGEVTG